MAEDAGLLRRRLRGVCNGHLVGGAGFRAGGPVAFYSRAHSFALPPPDAHGIISLALRFWLDQNTRFDNPSAGGLHAAPLLGLAATIRTLQAKDDTALILNQVATGGFLPLFFLLSGAASLWAWLKARGETAYLWLAIRLFINVLGAVVYESAVAGLLSQNVATVLQGVIIRAVLAPCWIVFWWYWFDLRRSRWILRATAALTLLDFASALCARATVHGEIPLHWATWLSPTNTLIKFGELALLAVIFAKGYRRDRTEALLALAPLAINEIDIFNGFSLEGRFGWDAPVLGMHIPPSAVASFVLVLTIAVLAVRRFLVVHSRELLAQQAIEAELVQVSELQKRVLVPEVSQSPYFQIETAYLPAQAVGGDFFQVLTHPDDSTLIVLGDVSGKGVTAAFLVAVLIGAIRTRADESFDPLAMLHTLNARLIDRSEGHFATCLAMHIQPDGKLLLANAGHLPPYRNGVEIDVPGALPLGVVGDVDLSVVTLQLSPSDQLTLLSDGIVEAMNAKGELFGFERTRTVSRQSAQTIAAEARHFGQTDDITAVTVTFTGPGPINATALAGQHPGQAG